MTDAPDPTDFGGVGGVGSVGEEAARLLGAVADWTRDVNDQLGDHLAENLATGAPECRYCPVCRTVHVLRQANPEVRSQLATAASSFLHAAAGLLAAAADSGEPASPTFERIDLGDV